VGEADWLHLRSAFSKHSMWPIV